MPKPSLDERFANDPILRERLHQIAALRDRLIGSGCSQPEPALAAKVIVTEMDGSLIPVVQPALSGDKRKGKTLAWREVRVCCARAVGQQSRCYGATLGTLESGSLLRAQTHVPGVGDGAP